MSRPDPEPATTASAQPPTDATDVRAATVPSAGPPAVPPPVLGGYRVVRLLGEGGMGAVYHARDDKLDRDVALKTMKPEIAAQPGAIERFLREARAAAKVAHDNVVPILHIGEEVSATNPSAAAAPFIVMPLLEGAALDKWLKRGPVSLGVVLKVGREVADGLAAAHAKGLIHRDIKPANIWIEGNPDSLDPAAQFRRAKILDFGLARPADDTQLTGPGAVLGTPAYMSPEQARAEPVDHRTDLFSLGVVLYRMTVGAAPFKGATTMAILTSLAVDEPPAPAVVNPDVPQPLSDLVMQLLSKNRDDRPASAAAVAAALREIGRQVVAARKAAESGSRPVVVHPVPIPQPGAPEPNPFTDIDATEPEDAPPATNAPRPRRRGAWIGAGLAVLLAGAAVFAVVKFGGPNKEQPAPVPDTGVAKADSKPAPQPKPQLPPPDPERKAAEWAINATGRLKIKVDGVTRDVTEIGELPASRFEVFVVRLSDRSDKVTDEGLAHLKETTALMDLHLQNTAITDAGLEHLNGLSGLGLLQLERTKVTRAGVEKIAKALPNCTITSDHGNFEPIGERPAADWVLSIGGKVTVKSGTGEVDITKARTLPNGLITLTKVNLAKRGPSVTGADLSRLKGLTALTYLNLASTSVADDGIDHVKGLTTLVTLDLTNTAVSDAGLEQLSGLKKLTVLYTSGAKVSAAGVAKLRTALPNCKVHSDHDTFEPKGDRAVVEWVLSAGGYVFIKQGRDELQISRPELLPPGAVVVTQIALGGAGPRVTDESLANLRGLTALTSLHLNGTAITDAGLIHLKDLKQLQKVYFTGSGITDAGLEYLKDTKALTTLQLAGTKVTDDGLAIFKDHTAITDLTLSNTAISDDGLAHIKNLTAMKLLTMHNTRVTGAGMVHLAGMTKLVELDLRNTGATDAGVAHLKGMKELQQLDLSNTKVTGAALAHLKPLTELVMLRLRGTMVDDASLDHLAGMNKLVGLFVAHTKVTADGAAKLKIVLPNCNILLDPTQP